MVAGGDRRLYGMLAELPSSRALVRAIGAARQAGYTRLDAYTPGPEEEVWEALEQKSSPLSLIVLLGGVLGALGGFGLQYWTSVIDYPINVGGRPLNSWPAFVPVTFELTVLVAGLAAVVGMLALNGLPRPHHPLFAVERFALASRDSYFLVVLAEDPRFDAGATRSFLESLDPDEVIDVEA